VAQAQAQSPRKDPKDELAKVQKPWEKRELYTARWIPSAAHRPPQQNGAPSTYPSLSQLHVRSPVSFPPPTDRLDFPPPLLHAQKADAEAVNQAAGRGKGLMECIQPPCPLLHVRNLTQRVVSPLTGSVAHAHGALPVPFPALSRTADDGEGGRATGE
jgi:hypothetical protein